MRFCPAAAALSWQRAWRATRSAAAAHRGHLRRYEQRQLKANMICAFVLSIGNSGLRSKAIISKSPAYWHPSSKTSVRSRRTADFAVPAPKNLVSNARRVAVANLGNAKLARGNHKALRFTCKSVPSRRVQLCLVALQASIKAPNRS